MTSTTTTRISPPNGVYQLISVWLRHFKVYTNHLISNALPPFMEPLIFLVGIGLGLGRYIDNMGGVPYIQFLSVGLLISSSMFTSAFECTYGTFIRLKFDRVYFVMLGAPITPYTLLLGELFWAGTKGAFFSFAVLIVVTLAGILSPGEGVFAAPILGFLNALMFGSVGFLITSFVKSISHFSFFFSGLLSPMFFFAGVVFPLENLPASLRSISEIVPLTHTVRLMRAATESSYQLIHLWDIGYIILFIAVFAFFGVRRLKKILIV